MLRPKQEVETFPDGIVKIYAAGSGRATGAYKGSLRFAKQSVGVNRFYSSQESMSTNRIDRVIKVLHTSIADRMDYATTTDDDRQYRILRIQEKPERGVDLWELEAVRFTVKEGSKDENTG